MDRDGFQVRQGELITVRNVGLRHGVRQELERRRGGGGCTQRKGHGQGKEQEGWPEKDGWRGSGEGRAEEKVPVGAWYGLWARSSDWVNFSTRAVRLLVYPQAVYKVAAPEEEGELRLPMQAWCI